MNYNKIFRIIGAIFIIIVTNIQIIDMLKVKMIGYEFILGYIVGICLCYSFTSLIRDNRREE